MTIEEAKELEGKVILGRIGFLGRFLPPKEINIMGISEDSKYVKVGLHYMSADPNFWPYKEWMDPKKITYLCKLP